MPHRRKKPFIKYRGEGVKKTNPGKRKGRMGRISEGWFDVAKGRTLGPETTN